MSGNSDSWGERENSVDVLSPPTSSALPSKVEALTPLEPGPAPCAPVEFDWLAPPQQPEEMGRLGPSPAPAISGKAGRGMVFGAGASQLRRRSARKVRRPPLAAGTIPRERSLREGEGPPA